MRFPRLRPRTIEGRIAALTFLLLTLVLALVSLAVVSEVTVGAIRSVDRRLESEAEALAGMTRFDGKKVVFGFDEETLPSFAASTPGRRAGYFQITGPDGLVERSRQANAPILPAPDAALLAPHLDTHEHPYGGVTLETTAGLMRVRTLAFSRPSVGASDRAVPRAVSATVVIQVARNYGEVDHIVHEAREALWASVPFGLLIGTLGTFLVARRATRPIARLGREASEVGTGSLEKRLDLATVEGELLELARALNGAFDRLAGAVARERRFSSDVAHELRTPLSITRSTLELALSRERSNDDYKEAIRQSLAANARLESIVSSLLLLGRAESVVLERKSLDLRPIVAAAVDSLAPQARRANVPVKSTLPESACLVVGQATLLERLVANLVENALRHGASPQGVEVSLEATPGDAGLRAVLAVRDRGPGFAEGFAARAFERFARADDSRARASGGAGLGLSIARAIVHAHQGEIVARPRQGGGAELLVTLPLAPAPPSAPPTGS